MYCWIPLSYIVAPLLIYWSMPATAYISIDVVSPKAAVGENVLLLVHNLPENLGAFSWYKPPFPAKIFEIMPYVTVQEVWSFFFNLICIYFIPSLLRDVISQGPMGMGLPGTLPPALYFITHNMF